MFNFFSDFSQDVQRYRIKCYIILYFGGNVLKLRLRIAPPVWLNSCLSVKLGFSLWLTYD